MTAELAARITAGRATLADYRRAVEDADPADRALWGARVADALASLLEVLGEPDPGDAATLAEIRAVLAAFDWERDDRQYALERIEMIAETGA